MRCRDVIGGIRSSETQNGPLELETLTNYA
jgi:hypothetical protein